MLTRPYFVWAGKQRVSSAVHCRHKLGELKRSRLARLGIACRAGRLSCASYGPEAEWRKDSHLCDERAEFKKIWFCKEYRFDPDHPHHQPGERCPSKAEATTFELCRVLQSVFVK